jgi:hypothetical protein
MMISGRHFVGICLGLMTGFWYGPGAFAQARPASPQPTDAGHPTVEEVSRVTHWDTIQWVERRYKIEAIRFKARDETGFDWLGSDEVMVQTNDAKGMTVSNEIGGIDSGDTHNFDPAKSCIVGVRPGVVVLGKTSVCGEVGEPAPLSFQVEFWEKDFGLPPYGFQVPPGEPGPGEHMGPWWADDEYDDDDFIGRAQIDYPTQDLEAVLLHVGDEVVETVKLDPCPGWTCAGYPDYTFTWRVTRLPDVRVNLGSELNEAMRRSGAHSELEVIGTGLRYLRAPRPRNTEPNAVDPSAER